MKPYVPRRIQFRNLIAFRKWRIKRYTITRSKAGDAADWSDFAAGRELAAQTLPEPAHTSKRPGLAFLVEHRGAGSDYIVLCWWDRENELPVRVFVREQSLGSLWRPATGGESFCVWDLQVIEFERNAYVGTLLAKGADATAADDYLEMRLSVEAD
ncbi:MAG: hypothetical protein ABIQ55_09800 [Gemmatimonadaceae bacterium]